MARTPPWWLSWIVDSLDLGPADQLLEIGCGGGALAALVCDRLSTGRITAIDRSAAAIAKASARNAAQVQAGRAVFHRLDLAEVGWASQRFNKIIAVNMSALWIAPAEPEWGQVLHHLRPSGSVRLFHRSATPARSGRVATAIEVAMARQGLASSTAFDATGTVCGVIGTVSA